VHGRVVFSDVVRDDLRSQRGFGGLVVSMLASGTQDRGFAPDRRIFPVEKKSSGCLPSEGK
jgi:hypothetical protein